MNDDKTSLKALYVALQEEMISKANFSAVLSHPTDKGDNAEENWISWFNKYLPQRYKAAKATVIDSKGMFSDQIDVVLYDAQYSYLAFNNKGILYVPAESVYAIFEVKQELSKSYMEYAGKKAESVRKLYRTSAPIPYANGTYAPKRLHRILAGILTTSCGWKSIFGKSFISCLENYSNMQQIDCGCVLKSGSYFFDYKELILSTSTADESLVFFFLQLLILLQKIGTVPAIDLNEYKKTLSIKEERISGETKGF